MSRCASGQVSYLPRVCEVLSLVCTECPEVRQIDVQQPVVSLLWQTKATLLICDENTQTSHEVYLRL